MTIDTIVRLEPVQSQSDNNAHKEAETREISSNFHELETKKDDMEIMHLSALLVPCSNFNTESSARLLLSGNSSSKM